MSMDVKGTDLFVKLQSGVGLRLLVVALEPPASDHFDELPAKARIPDYPEVIEAAQLIAAGCAERWNHQMRTT